MLIIFVSFDLVEFPLPLLPQVSASLAWLGRPNPALPLGCKFTPTLWHMHIEVCLDLEQELNY